MKKYGMRAMRKMNEEDYFLASVAWLKYKNGGVFKMKGEIK